MVRKLYPLLEKANIDYDNGFGSREIDEDLVIVGDNWWLERGGYGGSEWWNFQTIPIKHYNATKYSDIMLRVGL